MKETEQIKDEFAKFASRFGPAAIRQATVTAVNDDATVAVEFSDGSTVDDARLKSVVKGGNQFVLVPKAGSVVLVGRISNEDEYYCVAVDEISEVNVLIDGCVMRVDGKFLFKNASEDLLTLMKELVNAMINERHMTNTGPTISLTPDSVTAYNAIKTRFENLLNSN